jgi:hypothetical protein
MEAPAGSTRTDGALLPWNRWASTTGSKRISSICARTAARRVLRACLWTRSVPFRWQRSSVWLRLGLPSWTLPSGHSLRLHSSGCCRVHYDPGGPGCIFCHGRRAGGGCWRDAMVATAGRRYPPWVGDPSWTGVQGSAGAMRNGPRSSLWILCIPQVTQCERE